VAAEELGSVGRADLYGDRDRVAQILSRGGTWAVVGLSNNRGRAAHGVAAFLMDRGIRVVPVHPRAEVVHGQPGYPNLRAAAAAVGPIDVVDIFVRSSLVEPIVDEAIAIGASAVWLQLGVISVPAARRARAAGLLTVMDQCPAQVWDSVLGAAPDPDLQGAGETCAWVPPQRGAQPL
jgi:predicted CoA-binding protein